MINPIFKNNEKSIKKLKFISKFYNNDNVYYIQITKYCYLFLYYNSYILTFNKNKYDYKIDKNNFISFSYDILKELFPSYSHEYLVFFTSRFNCLINDDSEDYFLFIFNKNNEGLDPTKHLTMLPITISGKNLMYSRNDLFCKRTTSIITVLAEFSNYNKRRENIEKTKQLKTNTEIIIGLIVKNNFLYSEKYNDSVKNYFKEIKVNE